MARRATDEERALIELADYEKHCWVWRKQDDQPNGELAWSTRIEEALRLCGNQSLKYVGNVEDDGTELIHLDYEDVQLLVRRTALWLAGKQASQLGDDLRPDAVKALRVGAAYLRGEATFQELWAARQSLRQIYGDVIHGAFHLLDSDVRYFSTFSRSLTYRPSHGWERLPTQMHRIINAMLDEADRMKALEAFASE